MDSFGTWFGVESIAGCSYSEFRFGLNCMEKLIIIGVFLRVCLRRVLVTMGGVDVSGRFFRFLRVCVLRFFSLVCERRGWALVWREYFVGSREAVGVW